jgi:hypothetical protein
MPAAMSASPASAGRGSLQISLITIAALAITKIAGAQG